MENSNAFGECEKGLKYEEKLMQFNENIASLLMMTTNTIVFNKSDLNEAIKLINNDNVIVPNLPLFRYKGKVMTVTEEKLNIDGIKKHLENNDLIFLYGVHDMEYSESDELKFRTLILNEND